MKGVGQKSEGEATIYAWQYTHTELRQSSLQPLVKKNAQGQWLGWYYASIILSIIGTFITIMRIGRFHRIQVSMSHSINYWNYWCMVNYLLDIL